jgi:hypothetical protein
MGCKSDQPAPWLCASWLTEMPLIVEDGSGLPDANAYVDIPYISTYLLGEQLEAWEALTESEQESAIIRATRAVDILFNWLGTRETLGQGLSWPRSNVVYEGFEIEGVPTAVQKATAEAVGLVLGEAEFFSEEADVEIASEKVDVIAVSYRTGQAGEKKEITKFEVLNCLVRGLYRIKNGGFRTVPVERV